MTGDAEQETVVLRNKLLRIVEDTPGSQLYAVLVAYTTDAVVTAYTKGYEAGYDQGAADSW